MKNKFPIAWNVAWVIVCLVAYHDGLITHWIALVASIFLNILISAYLAYKAGNTGN